MVSSKSATDTLTGARTRGSDAETPASMLVPLSVGFALGLFVAGMLVRPRVRFSNSGKIVPVITTVIAPSAGRVWSDGIVSQLLGGQLSRLVAYYLPGFSPSKRARSASDGRISNK